MTLQALTRESDVLWQRLEAELSETIQLVRQRASLRQKRREFIQYAKQGGPRND